MNEFKIHTPETATREAADTLRNVEEGLGFIPNVFAVIAESAPALEAFVGLNFRLAESSLAPTERELVQLAVSVENECAYCVAGHSAFANMQDLDMDVVAAARCGGTPADPRLAALDALVKGLVNAKGPVDPALLEGFYAAGYESRHLFEVILGICVKTFSNLTNSATGLTLDDEFASFAWTPDQKIQPAADPAA
jgi:AhpD family alkylhydroperoxidase